MKSWKRKLRMGMVGGGQGAFIGGVHRIAATLDQQVELVTGCFSRDPDNTRVTGNQLYLDPSRCYQTYEEMAGAEAKLPDDQRIDFVTIVTPKRFALPHRQNVSRGRLPCRLRQADDLQPRRSEAALRAGGKDGTRLRAYPQLYRTPLGEARPPSLPLE